MLARATPAISTKVPPTYNVEPEMARALISAMPPLNPLGLGSNVVVAAPLVASRAASEARGTPPIVLNPLPPA